MSNNQNNSCSSRWKATELEFLTQPGSALPALREIKSQSLEFTFCFCKAERLFSPLCLETFCMKHLQ